jgi:hypothetical protein
MDIETGYNLLLSKVHRAYGSWPNGPAIGSKLMNQDPSLLSYIKTLN